MLALSRLELCSRIPAIIACPGRALQYYVTLHTVRGHSLIGCIAAIGKTALTHQLLNHCAARRRKRCYTRHPPRARDAPRRRPNNTRRAFAASPKPTNAMRGPIGWGALAVTGAAGCGLAYYYEVEKTRRQEQAAKKQTTYGKPSLGGPWTLVDAKTNKPVTDASFHGSYVLLYFGFSRCPDICPSELKVQKVLRLLGDEAPTPLFVSLDPRRDSLRQLRAYGKDFDERVRFLVGICAVQSNARGLCGVRTPSTHWLIVCAMAWDAGARCRRDRDVTRRVYRYRRGRR